MVRACCVYLAALVALGFSATPLLAQGNSQGSKKSLKALSHAHKGSASGVKKAGDAIGHRGTGLGRAAKGVPDVAPGVKTTTTQPGANGEVPTDSTVQQQILDQRLSQAEHLRALSQRNGNERLLTTADRMEASAQRNYARQTGVTEEGANDDTQTSAVAPTQAVTPKRTAKRGFWFRFR